jgi:hypothetical protein
MENNLLSYKIDSRWLLRIYAIGLLLTAIILADYLFFENALLPYMGLTSLFLPLYLLFFEVPHIIASFLGFADKEYVQRYKVSLLIVLPLLLLSVGFLMYLNFTATVILYFCATMYHVIKQQTGIALILGAKKNLGHKVWSFLALLITTILYVYLILPELFSATLANIINYGVLGSVALFLIVGAWVVYNTQRPMAKKYIALTTLMVLMSYVFILLGYVFFAFFFIRFVHDVTAFYFYIVHEMNRNSQSIKNVLYRHLPLLPISLVILVPALAIVVGLTTRTVLVDQQMLFGVIILLGFAHYYLESIMWKRSTPHRQQIAVS